MARFTDIQSILLSSAAQRADGSLFPPPKTLGAVTERICTAVATLIKRRYADEVAVAAGDHAWRVDADLNYGAVINDAGRAAIGIEPDIAQAPMVEVGRPKQTAARTGAVRPTKANLILSLLQRAQGATLAELVEATGWLPHTVGAALTRIRKKGNELVKGKRAVATRYTLVA